MKWLVVFFFFLPEYPETLSWVCGCLVILEKKNPFFALTVQFWFTYTDYLLLARHPIQQMGQQKKEEAD